MRDTNKDRRYFIGAILVVAGYLICLMPYWWIFGTPLIFVTGFVLMWLSTAKILTKVLFTIIPVILWYPGFVAVMYFGTNHVKPATFLIPKDFRGKIIIYYGEPCGEKILEKNGKNIYNIPKNGVMIVKDQLETGIINEEYYFADDNYHKINKLDELYQQDFNEEYTLEKNKHEPSRKKVAIFLGGTGNGEHVNLKRKKYVFQEIYVNSWDSLRVFNNPKADSIALNLLKDCQIN
jgi:hypothetical protein